MNTQRIELENKYEFIGLVLRFEFRPFIPEYDDGIDFILHRTEGNLHLNVQLKSRWTVEKKYFGRKIWIAFPDEVRAGQRNWYLVPHDLMVGLGRINHANTESWKKGVYHKDAPAAGWATEYGAYKIDKLLRDLTSEGANSIDGYATEWAISP